MLKQIFRLLIGGVCLAAAASAGAQGGLTPEQSALFDRVLAAEKLPPTYSSYVEESFETMQLDMTLRMDGAAMSFVSDTTRQAEITVIQDDTLNVQGFITAEVSETTPDATYTYTLQAELRVVNQVMYVLVTGIPAEGSTLPDTVAALSTDWFVVGDPADFPALEPLDLGGVLPESGELDEENPFNNAELLAQANPDITLEQVKWGSGTADLITILIGAEGLLSIDLLGEAGLPVGDIEQAREALSQDSQVVYSITLDGAGNPLRRAMTMTMIVQGVDATQEDNSLPPGTTYDVSMNMQSVSKLSHVNEPAQPVSAP